jgi:NADPH2:quinone reductase
MKAIIIRQPGSPDVLQVQEAAVPSPSEHHVLVRVMASGLNRADILQRKGLYPAPAGVPSDIPGLEYAGVVDSIGADVTRCLPGDRVMGIVGGGSCAEFLVTHEELVLPIPPHLDFVQAAALPEAFVTAYDAMVVQGGLRKGGSFAITAATSGVGTAAIQIASAIETTAFGSTRSKEKLTRLHELGLKHAVHGEAPELVQAIRSSAFPKGVDVVVDLVAGAGLNTLLRGLRAQGTLVVVGLLGGAKAEINLAQLLAKRAVIRGTVMRNRSHEEKSELMERVRLELLPLFLQDKMKPVIDKVYPLADAQAAHTELEANQHVGKIVFDHR